MTFDELMALLREPGEDGVPSTIYDDLTSSYTLAVEGGVNALSEQAAMNDAAVAELVGEVARLKALNFDLLVAAGEKEPEKAPESEPESDPEKSIDALFD